MAILNLDYYSSENDRIYSDGEIENELLAFAKDDKFNWYDDKRWPVVYHMSDLRHNILNWFPFGKNIKILEIGAGCGALTGLLCDKACKVVAIELTRLRAEINYERHKKYSNLEIIVGDFKTILLKEKFDYIIINGVLEYAAYMINKESPHKYFLEVASQHLKEDGKILLAIENRIGIKYISGAMEDHTGEFFSGINNYRKGELVKTFSKNELTEVIKSANLYPVKFYYPYPDYKFPVEIFTDTTINKIYPSTVDNFMDSSRVNLFDKKDFSKTLMESQIMDIFSNSFLVEIAKNKYVSTNSYDYIKISANRKEEFRIFTAFDKKNEVVYKQALLPKGIEHIKAMSKYGKYSVSQIKNLKCEINNSTLFYKYINSPSLEDILVEYFILKNRDMFEFEINKVKKALFKIPNTNKKNVGKEFTKIFGKRECEQLLHWSDYSNIDMIAANIFTNKEEYVCIDYEWQLPCSIPLELILWRMLNQLINDHNMHEWVDEEWILSTLNITKDTVKCFEEWERKFTDSYVGIIDFSVFRKDIVPINLRYSMQQVLEESKIFSTLFFDYGEGFTEKTCELQKLEYTNDGFRVTFNSENFRIGLKCVRWDPLEGKCSRITIKEIKSDAKINKIEPIGAEINCILNEYEFFTFDPQIIFYGEFSNCTYITFDFKCEILDWKEGYKKRIIELKSKNDSLEEEIVNHQNTKDMLEKKVQENSNLQDININLNKEKEELIREKQHVERELLNIQHILNSIYESRSWKVISSVKKIIKR